MFTLLILDDDKNILDSLSKEISSLYPNINIITFSDFETFSENYSVLDYQFVLSDVFFGDVNGIKAHKIISKNGKTPVAYMSGNDPTTFDVYDAPHVYFLPKPIQIEKLNNALNKLFNAENFLRVKSFSSEHIVNFDDIYYLGSDRRIVHIVCKDNIYNVYAKLDSYVSLLDRGFIRISKSYIVNKKHIKGKEKDQVFLNNGETLPISRSYQKEVDDNL